jgi:hypothetical protein
MSDRRRANESEVTGLIILWRRHPTRCMTCEWFFQDDEGLMVVPGDQTAIPDSFGWCKRFPPSIPEPKSDTDVQPRVGQDDFCGEHKLSSTWEARLQWMA